MFKKLTIFIISAVISVTMLASPAYAATCGDTKTQYLACDSKTGTGTINDLIKIVVIVMTVLIGIAAVGGIAYAAVLYASARDSQSQISEAMIIIRNIVIGLLLYGFTIALINWLLPGSVIG